LSRRRYYGRHAYQPGFRCGVELDDATGNNNGSVNGYHYFSCAPGYGVLVDVRKVTLASEADDDVSDPLPLLPLTAAAFPDAAIGDESIATGDSKQVQIDALRKERDAADAEFATFAKRAPGATFNTSEGSADKNRCVHVLRRLVLSHTVCPGAHKLACSCGCGYDCGRGCSCGCVCVCGVAAAVAV
jgi:hypothetical protein